MMMNLRLSQAQSVAELSLDSGQKKAVNDITSMVSGERAHVIVTGAPGSGRTRVLMHLAEHYGSSAIVIAPDRLRADRLARTGPASRLASYRPVMSLSGFAFSILSETATMIGTQPPVLMTGPEEDALVREALCNLQISNENWPDWLASQAKGFTEFVRQLRRAVADAYDLRLSSADMHSFASKFGRPLWGLVGDIVDFMDTRREISSCAILWKAQKALSQCDGKKLLNEGALAPILIIDDSQDLSIGAISLLAELARCGCTLVMAYEGDLSVEMYRGAAPAKLRNWACNELGAREVNLGPSRRLSSAQLQACEALRRHCRWISGNDSETAEWSSCDEGKRATTESLINVDSASGEACNEALIAKLINWHYRDNVEWEQIAVVTRESSQAQKLSHEIRCAYLPLARRSSVLAFSSNPVTAALLSMLVNPFEVEPLITSPFVNVPPRWIKNIVDHFNKPLAQRRLDKAPEDVLPKDSIGKAQEQLATAWEQVERIQVAALQATGDIREDLWRVWDAAGVAEKWRAEAIKGDAVYDEHLDAVVALFRHADVYVQRNASSSTQRYCKEQLSSAIPQDTIANGAVSANGITVGTVAQVAGRSFKRVAIVGMQQGKWPNPVVRDGLFQMERLRNSDLCADILEDEQKVYKRSFENTIVGELRWAIIAISRASEQTAVFTVSSVDDLPSYLVGMLNSRDKSSDSKERSDNAVADAARRSHELAIDEITRGGLRQLVARLRQAIIDPQSVAVQVLGEEKPGIEEEVRRAGASLLAFLAKRDVRSADPRFWTGQLGSAGTGVNIETSSDGCSSHLITSLKAPWGKGVHVSPSAVDKMITCPLRWAWDKLGGAAPTSISMEIGTFIHDLAEKYAASQIGKLELIKVMEDEAKTAGLCQLDTHSGRVQWRKLKERIANLAWYLSLVNIRKDTLFAVEKSYETPVGDVVISGKVDRIEQAESNGQIQLNLVDFKTGGSGHKKTAEENPQLAVYQWLVQEEEKLEVKGAKLVLLGDTLKTKVKTAEQSANAQSKVPQLLDQASQVALGSEFKAIENDGCKNCTYSDICPLGRDRTMP